MWTVYLADMRSPETSSPEVWEAFMDGDFSVQKSEILATSIGRDHAGEQKNKVIKKSEVELRELLVMKIAEPGIF